MIGSFGLFFTAFLLFCRFLPMISMSEVKTVIHEPAHGRKEARREPAAPRGGGRERDRAARRGGGVPRAWRPDARRVLPLPIHGIDDVLGIRRSRLTIVCFVAGLVGCAVGLLAQYWTSAVDWPLDIAGKPFDSLPAFVPVAFELTVLFGGLATALVLLGPQPPVAGKRPSPPSTPPTSASPTCASPTTASRSSVSEPGAALPEGELDTCCTAMARFETWEETQP